MPGDVSITLTFAELQTLQKTIGIALDNVGRKAEREPDGSPQRATAVRDYKNLQSINSELSLALADGIG